MLKLKENEIKIGLKGENAKKKTCLVGCCGVFVISSIMSDVKAFQRKKIRELKEKRKEKRGKERKRKRKEEKNL